jgi:hypothetical protein
VTLLTAVNVGTVLILTERLGKLSLGGSTVEEVILEMNLSSGFTILIIVPLVHVTEIWKRIEFINSWGKCQVNIYIYIYIFFDTRLENGATSYYYYYYYYYYHCCYYHHHCYYNNNYYYYYYYHHYYYYSMA